MSSDNENVSVLTSKGFLDGLIRFCVIVVLAVSCIRTFSPFINIMLWGLIIAIMLYPLHQKLAKRLGGKQGRAAVILVVIGCLLIDVPVGFLGVSFINNAHDVRTAYENNELNVPEPDPKVAQWPVVGPNVYDAWTAAHANFKKFLVLYKDQLKTYGTRLISMVGDAAGTVFFFFGALIIAGIMMAWGKSGSAAMQRIMTRLDGPVKGPQLHLLSVATVRSVATGVLGVALIQALLFGIGFVMAGIPFAVVLALAVLFIGIIQLPAIIVALPVIIYLWAGGDGSTTSNIAYTVYFVVAGTSDNVLKPLLLGRGVDAPMPVILIGALGGMVAKGFIGLFLGAILLAVGYQIFMGWVDDPELQTTTDTDQPDAPQAIP